MSSSQTVQPRTADGLLIDGVMSYEAGDVHSALARWRDALVLDPSHPTVSRYCEFVRAQLLIDEHSSLAEVRAAQERFKKQLTGEVAPPQTLMPAAPSRSESHQGQTRQSVKPSADFEVPALHHTLSAQNEPEAFQANSPVQHDLVQPVVPLEPDLFPMSNARQIETVPLAHEEAPQDASQAETAERPLSPLPPLPPLPQRATPPQPSLTEVTEEAPTQPPVQVAPSAVSSVSQQALEGPGGPLTQADGLSIQTLSRQLAELHRSGQYAQAVQTAEALLEKDPQHAVARRYIDEYHRQREVAKSRRRVERKISEAPQAQTPPSTQAFSSREIADEEEPTRAPNAIVQRVLSPDKLDLFPRVLIPVEQIQWDDFDHLAGFFVSQIDGRTSYEDLLTISGMPRQEALALLERLLEHGIIVD